MSTPRGLVEWLGWAATAVFVASYFTRAAVLKRVQMAGALMWVGYGLLNHSLPIILSNAAGAGLVATLLAMKFRFDRHPAKD